MKARFPSSPQLYRCLILVREQLNKGGELRWIPNQISIGRDYNIAVLKTN
jgi:hypothetical protein